MDVDQLACTMLNLPMTHDHRRLLGVPRDRFDVIAVDMALRRRLAQLRVHPEGASEEAQEVRAYLKHIATDLKQYMPETFSQKQQNQHQMTSLDQAILAVLIGEGGWNRRSRARLVAVAASYSITARGLMRILEALAVASREGDGPLTVNRRKRSMINRSWTAIPAQKSKFSIVDEFIERTTKKLTPELHAPTPVMTIKLAVFFALLTLIAFVLSLQVLLSSDLDVQDIDELSSDLTRYVRATDEDATTTQLPQLLFDQYPTFQQVMKGSLSINAADVAMSMTTSLEELSRSIRATFLRGEAPKESWIETWLTATTSTSTGFLYIDSSVLSTISDRLIDVLVQSEQQQTYTETLIHELRIPLIKTTTPHSVFQKVWYAGIIARINCDERLSSATRTTARQMQIPSISVCDELQAREQTLELVADELIEITEFDASIFPLWENWIAMIKKLHAKTASNAIYMQAIEQLLRTNVDLSRESNTRKVLGRIVNEMGWAQNTIGRDSVVAMYQDQTISTNDLYALGHLFLASDNTSWFADTHLVHPNEPQLQRITIAKRLKSDWPIEISTKSAIWNLKIPAGFNLELAKSWKSRFREVTKVSSFDPTAIARLRILNEAAVALWRGRSDIAETVIDKLDNLNLFLIDDSYVNTLLPDGEWSKRFSNTRTNHSRLLDLIEELGSEGYTELGPQDANTLASAALTHRSSKVGSAAASMIIDQFAQSRNVAIAILNQRRETSSKQIVTKLVAHLTDVILPEITDPRWIKESHRALVQHALTVTHTNQRQLDAVANELATSLIAELVLIEPTTLPPSSDIDATSVMSLLVETWRRDLLPLQIPKRNLDFNPTGVMQQYLQHQLDYLQLLRADETDWRGIELQDDQHMSTSDMGNTTSSIVAQITQVELTIARHWLRLIEDLITEFERQMER